jgi:hypothetical protein
MFSPTLISQVPWAHTTLSTKERSRCVIIAASGSSSNVSSSAAGPAAAAAAAFIGEPVAFYKLPSGAGLVGGGGGGGKEVGDGMTEWGEGLGLVAIGLQRGIGPTAMWRVSPVPGQC